MEQGLRRFSRKKSELGQRGKASLTTKGHHHRYTNNVVVALPNGGIGGILSWYRFYFSAKSARIRMLII